jgi:hypothetical protein
MSKLKKCPFCGKEAIVIQRKNKMWDIGCTTDMLCIGWICSDKKCQSCTCGYSDKQSAIDYWNRRS